MSFSGSGTYQTETKTVTFIIKGKEKTVGDVTITVSYTDDENEGIITSTKMEFTLVSDGMNIPTSNELIIRDIVYDGNTPISACFINRLLQQDAVMAIDGALCTVNSSQISTVYLDTATTSISLDMEQQSETTVGANTMKINQSAASHLMLKKGSIYYAAFQNNTETFSLSGNNTVFSAPKDAEVPSIVFDLAEKAYSDLVKD